MKKLMQVRKLRFVPLNRTARTRLHPGDRLEVVRVRRSNSQKPERVTIRVVQELPPTDHDLIGRERVV
jgi:hypothetical protein